VKNKKDPAFRSSLSISGQIVQPGQKTGGHIDYLFSKLE
jgi:hypothetical protein